MIQIVETLYNRLTQSKTDLIMLSYTVKYICIQKCKIEMNIIRAFSVKKSFYT